MDRAYLGTYLVILLSVPKSGKTLTRLRKNKRIYKCVLVFISPRREVGI